jgi:hypothetical protein
MFLASDKTLSTIRAKIKTERVHNKTVAMDMATGIHDNLSVVEYSVRCVQVVPVEYGFPEAPAWWMKENNANDMCMERTGVNDVWAYIYRTRAMIRRAGRP